MPAERDRGRRRRRRVNMYHDRPNDIFCGRPTTPPMGVRGYPGPRTVRRIRGYVHVMIHWREATLFSPGEWRASIFAGPVDSGLIATGSDLDTIQRYLLERFAPCWWTVYDRGADGSGPAADPSPTPEA